MFGLSQKQALADSLQPAATVDQQTTKESAPKLKIEELEARLAPAGKSDLVDSI